MKIRWKVREMKGMEKRSGCDGGEVVRVEDGNDDEVEGSADAEVGVAMVEKVRTDPGVVDRVVGHGKSDDDSAGEDEPPKTGGTVPRIFFCIPFATPVKNASDGPQDQIFLRFSGQLLVENFLFSGSSGSVEGLPSLNDWAAAMSNLECKCPAVDGLPNHSGNSSDCVCPLSNASVTSSAPVTRSTRISCIVACAMPANVKLMMERKRKIRVTALCRRIFARCVTWKKWYGWLSSQGGCTVVKMNIVHRKKEAKKWGKVRCF
jgi:hypothetical protein